MTTDGTTGDAVDFLLGQHEDIRNLFKHLPQAAKDEREEQFLFLLRLLAVHETAEEMVVYPALRQFVPGGAGIAEARKREEDEGKKALVELEALGVESPKFERKLTQLRDLVFNHAAAEEETVFPALREHVGADVLTKLRAALVAAEAAAPTHPHSFAPESAVGNLVSGPVLAVVDRVRDAVHAVTH